MAENICSITTGDKGQRYEVSFANGGGGREIMGWANHVEGAMSMVKSINLHPSWHEPQIFDRANKLMIALGSSTTQPDTQTEE